MSRTENAVRNIIWGVVEKITSLLLPFINRTLLINLLGAEYLGMGSLFTSILNVLSVTELGFCTAIAFSMYKPIAEEDNNKLCALLNSYKKIYRCVGAIILIGGLIALPFLDKLIKGGVQADVNIYILYLIYLFNAVISYFLFSYKNVLFSAHQRNDVGSKLGIAINIGVNIVQCVVLLLFQNYYTFVFVTPVATVINNLSRGYLAKKYYPQIICKGTLDKETKESIKKRVIGLLSFKINGVLLSSVDTIVISSILGLVPLAIFNNYNYIQTSIIGFLTILTGAITAGIGNKMITDDRDENYKNFKGLVFVNGWLCSWCSVCLVCLYNHFINWWIGEDFIYSMDTVILMVLCFFIPRITTITYIYREAAGLWYEDRFRPIISSVANLILSIILVKQIGINGVIIGTLVASVVISVPWGTMVLFKNYFKFSPMEYFGKIIYYIIITAICAGITYLICSLLPSVGLGIMLVKGIICLVVPNAIFWLIYHKMEEYKYFMAMIKNIFSILLKKVGK